MSRWFYILPFFVFCFLSFPVFAQDTAEQEMPLTEEEVAREEQILSEEDAAEAMNEQEESAAETYEMVSIIMRDIGPAEQRHFMTIYSNYNLIETVRVVQEDVGNAVEECSANNPEMAGDMNARYEEWNAEVNPALEEAQANVDNMVMAQDYLAPADAKTLFKSIDNTRAKTRSRIEKVPVTTPDACEFLLGKMDETQSTMVGLLRTTLLSMPPGAMEPGAMEPEPQGDPVTDNL